ncbi:hypothetical protein [Micromonospora sp. RL09-050-HVF-A]|uniref:hypothetical protein n=1 Tax=Micromonospora sp. RL09-050-HVF-A TaxID=1703433 RepID=UPI001C5FD1B1|nr:hypothetical protein [Micromonospora sp. RL09-050-HVF-A]
MAVIEVVKGDITRENVDAIATGVYGYRAARVAVATVRATPTNLERIRLVAFDDDTHAHLRGRAGGGRMTRPAGTGDRALPTPGGRTTPHRSRSLDVTTITRKPDPFPVDPSSDRV